MTYENIHTETAAGFDIVFSVAPEIDAPDWEFESPEDERETLERINRGDLAWFIAKVEAYKNGICLGTDYLGGCCYESPLQFVNASDYYGDMVENVVNQARKNIALLCEGVDHV